jgi:hypothetical protein
MQGANEILQDLLWADLAEQVSQALFGNGAKFPTPFAPAFRSNDSQEAFVFAKQGRLFGRCGSGEKARRLGTE